MSSVLTELGGFTPIMDIVTQDVGLTTSVVYGLVWRHCQMQDRVCKKSVPELAEMLEVSPRTVRRHLEKLCKNGYIRDTTPGLRNRPHVYVDTGKVKITGKVEAILSESRYDKLSRQDNLGMTKSHGRYDKLSRPLGQIVTPAVTESPMNKTWRPFEETGRGESPPAFSQSFEELAKRALVIYSDTAQIKLDKTQAGAITNLIKAEPEFNFTRWVAACTSVKLGGVKPENVQCRIDTYKAGGNYQAMISAKRNGNGAPDAPAPKVELRGIDPAAYRAQLEADRAAATETKEMVNKTFEAGVTAAGLDVERAIRREKRHAKKAT